MASSHYAPAAGASGGRAPLYADLRLPEWLRLDSSELDVLLNRIRYPLATQVFLLMAAHCDFGTGEFLGSYARLMALCTPPGPRKGPGGRSLEQPTYWKVRKAIDLLVEHHLAWRGTKNEEQGQLRIKLLPRKKRTK